MNAYVTNDWNECSGSWMGGVYDSLGWVIEMALPEEDTKKKKKRVRQAEKKTVHLFVHRLCFWIRWFRGRPSQLFRRPHVGGMPASVGCVWVRNENETIARESVMHG